MVYSKIQIIAGPGKIAVGIENGEITFIVGSAVTENIDTTKFSIYTIEEGYSSFIIKDADDNHAEEN